MSNEIKAYYDEHLTGKLSGFVNTNPRVELAWQTVLTYAPENPRCILEIGCGIGDICHRMSQTWREAQVIGLDISPKSIETARKLFGTGRLSFVEGILSKGKLQPPFDLIIMMDVYEHIAGPDRNQLHEAIASLLSSEGRIILSFPTPRYLAYLKKYVPKGIQPVDEDINVKVISQLAEDTHTEVLLYKEVKVWHPGDYTHAVLAKPQADWTEQSYRATVDNISISDRLKRIAGKVLFKNNIFSPKTMKAAYVRKKLGKDSYPNQ
jgi:2-polyprenyl-3-methyl-5-hydroxy-6-metoxy-1,4-benzoquinol methylase